MAAAKTIHGRPALMQGLEWRAPYSPDERGSDPVQPIVFRFYNDQLYKIVVGYGHSPTVGMTGTDMIEGISATYVRDAAEGADTADHGTVRRS